MGNSGKLVGLETLLVEDNEINRMVVAELLEQEGATVTMAHNGRQCLEKLALRRFDVIVMDIQMPEMDGYEATRLLRRKGLTLPVVAMTAHAAADEMERCRQAGMNGHFKKPVDPKILYETLESLCRWDLPEARDGRPAALDVGPCPGDPGKKGRLPRSLDGIDMADGLFHVGQNPTLYLDLLVRFKTRHTIFPEQLGRALEQQRFKKAAGLVHTLKGIAANLGAKDLSRAADRAEIQLSKMHDGTLETVTGDLMVQLSRVLKSLEGIADKGSGPEDRSDPGPATPVDPQSVPPLLSDLEWYLKSDLAAAMETLDTLEPCMKGSAREKLFCSLRQQVASFDTDDALETLSRLRESLDDG